MSSSGETFRVSCAILAGLSRTTEVLVLRKRVESSSARKLPSFLYQVRKELAVTRSLLCSVYRSLSLSDFGSGHPRGPEAQLAPSQLCDVKKRQ